MTQMEKVIAYMTKNGVITTKDATDDLWIMDLQGVIRNLRNAGYVIYDKWIKSRNSRYKAYAFKKKYLDDYEMLQNERLLQNV